MKSTQKQFCTVIQHCQEQYSENTMGKLVDLLYSHEAVIKLYNMVLKNPTEQEFLKMLDETFPTE